MAGLDLIYSAALVGAFGGGSVAGAASADDADDGGGGYTFNMNSRRNVGQNPSMVFQDKSHRLVPLGSGAPSVDVRGFESRPEANMTSKMFFNDSVTASANNSELSAFMYISTKDNTFSHSMWKDGTSIFDM